MNKENKNFKVSYIAACDTNNTSNNYTSNTESYCTSYSTSSQYYYDSVHKYVVVMNKTVNELDGKINETQEKIKELHRSNGFIIFMAMTNFILLFTMFYFHFFIGN